MSYPDSIEGFWGKGGKKKETLEEIIEDIGKRMCHFHFLYPNAGKWMIKDRWGWEYKGETLIEVFTEFREELKRNGHYN